MASFKVFLSFAVLVACVVAIQAAEEAPKPDQFIAPQPEAPQPETQAVQEGHQRDKKQAILVGHPIAYSYPAVVPAAPVVSSYSYFHRSLPYPYYPYAYPPAYIV